jgi:hypothetical protein
MGLIDGLKETSRHEIMEQIDADLTQHAERLQHESRHYAAVLSAITDTRPDIPGDERAILADAIVRRLHERATEYAEAHRLAANTK